MIDEVIIQQDSDGLGVKGNALAQAIGSEIVVARGAALPPDFPEGAVLQGDGSVVLTLGYPVVFKFKDASGAIVGGNTYTTLHLKRLKGKHQIEIRKASENILRAQMIACSTGLSLGDAEMLHNEMDATDITAALRIISFFTTPGRRTGP